MELTLSIYRKINGSKIILPIGEYYKDELVVSKQYTVIHSNPLYIVGVEERMKMKEFNYIPALEKVSGRRWKRNDNLYECEEFEGLNLNGKLLDKLFNELYEQGVREVEGKLNLVNDGVSNDMSMYTLFTNISFITISRKNKGKFRIYCKINSTPSTSQQPSQPFVSIKFDDNKLFEYLRVVNVADESLEPTLHTQLEHVENISEICMKLYEILDEILDGNCCSTATSQPPPELTNWFSTTFLPTHKYIPKKDNILPFIKFLLTRSR